MKDKNSKTIITGILAVVFATLIFSAAYAVIGANFSLNNANGSLNLGTRPIFTADASDQISLNIPPVGETSNTLYVVAEDNSSINIILSAQTRTNCTYKLYWVWDETLNVANQYSKTSGATKEYTVSGSNGSDSFTETQLSDYSASSEHKMLLKESSILVSGSTQANQVWNINAKFYKTTQDQSNHKGKNYSGKIVVSDVICRNQS